MHSIWNSFNKKTFHYALQLPLKNAAILLSLWALFWKRVQKRKQLKQVGENAGQKRVIPRIATQNVYGWIVDSIVPVRCSADDLAVGFMFQKCSDWRPFFLGAFCAKRKQKPLKQEKKDLTMSAKSLIFMERETGFEATF
jgi:hypothetical protein